MFSGQFLKIQIYCICWLGKYCGDSFDMTEYRQNLLFRFAEKRANELIKNHGLLEKGWTFKWNKNKRSFGICRYQQKRIELSAILRSIKP